MSRLQKKCLVASSAFHGALILVLLFGSALMPKPEETSNFKPLKMWSAAAISAAETGGGELAPALLPSQPTQAAPAPPTPPAPVVTPPESKPPVEPPKPVIEHPKSTPRVVELPKVTKRVVETVKPKEVEPETHWYDFSKSKTKTKVEAKEEPAPPTKHKVVIDKGDLAMHKASEKPAREVSNATAEANARAEKNRVARELSSSIRTLGKNLGPSSMVDLSNVGDGSGGQASVNYGDVIISKYLNAWSPPADLDDNQPIVSASITILRDGTVKSAHISKGSGNRSMDRSIERALEAVTFIEQFPPSWKESEKTITVKFNLQLKRQNG